MKIFKKIINLVYYILLLLLILIAGVYLFTNPGVRTKLMMFAVETGSMSPKIPQGSIVLVSQADSYQKDDVITFRDQGNPKNSVTHRIVEVSEDKDLGKISYRVKGDANEEPDPELVAKERVLGKVIFSVPFVGHAVAFAKTQVGFIVLIIIPATLIISSELGNIKKEIAKMFNREKKDTKKQDEKKDGEDVGEEKVDE